MMKDDAGRGAVPPSTTATRIVHGILGGTGQTVVTIMASIIQLRLIIAFLPTDAAGTWFLFLSIGAYFAYFDLGISPTLSREISFITGRQPGSVPLNDRTIPDLIATCQRMFQTAAVVVFFLGLVLGWLFLNAVAPGVDRNVLGGAWLIFTIGASLNLLGGAAFAALYGTGNVATERIIRASTQFLGLALSALLLAFGAGIIGLAVAWAAQNIIARIAGWRMLYRYHPELKTAQGRASAALARSIAAPSLKWAAMGVGAILILQTDNPIIAATLGVGSIPPYEAVAKIIAALMTFSLLIVTSSTPFISKAYAAREINTVSVLLLRNVRFGMAVMIVLASYLALFGDRVIEAWLGPGNFVGFPVLWTLLVMLTLEVHHVIHATATMAAGHLVFLRPAIFAGILKVVLSILLARTLGLWGIALGTLIAQLATNNWYAPYTALRFFNLPLRRYAGNVAAPLVLLLLALLAANAGLRQLTDGLPPFPGAVLAFLASSAAGLAMTYWLLMLQDERRVFERAIAFWR
jgi:O-antigen/teichoic acid export membrane protein